MSNVDAVKLEQLKDYNLIDYINPYNFVMLGAAKTYMDVLQTNFAFSSPSDQKLLSSYRATGFSGAGLASSLDRNDIEATFTAYNDTSLGGNDAINCRWGFGRDDDIIHPINAIGGNPDNGGLGRVYFENYQVHQQLLSINVGVPEFMEMWEFYSTCMDGEFANTVNSGEGNLAKDLGGFIGDMITTTIKIAAFPVMAPFQAISAVGDAIDTATGKVKVSRYYEVKPAMRLYYKYVNNMFARVAVALGMAGPLATSSGSSSANISISDLYQGSGGALPQWMSYGGLSMINILNKRNKITGGDSNQGPQADGGVGDDQTIEVSGGRGAVGDSYHEPNRRNVSQADKYISFRINKNTDSSESLSNSTGQSSIANALNAAASAGKDARFSMSGGIDNIFKIGGIGDALGAARDVLTGVINSVGIGSLATTVMTGSGFIDIPDVWTSSSFTKNHNFSMTFRPGSGNSVAVMQDCYVPLIMLLALACPRTVGGNSYTSPFIIRAYCRGMFAVPIGIVESMSITRGASEFGWNMNRLPTVINVNMSIKDLTPVMHLALNYKWSDDLFLTDVNTTAQSYVQALSGLGPQEMLYKLNRIKRQVAFLKYTAAQTFTSENITDWAANTSLGKIVGAINTSSPQRGQ